MLKARVLTALVLLILFAPIFLLLPALDLYLSFIVILSIAAWEWGRFLWPAKKSMPIAYAFLIFVCLVFLLGQHQGLFQSSVLFSKGELFQYPIYLAAFVWIFTVPFFLKMSLSVALTKWVTFLSILGFIIFIGAFCAAMVLRDEGRWLFLGVIGIVWCADIGAYFVGRKFGRNKLASNISPGKSWEGLVGGVLIACLFVLLIVLLVKDPRFSLFSVILVTMFLALMSVMGDLFESLIKRIAKVKDSSNLLPGHGGVLDRIDAILPVLPIAALLLKVSL
ncbi:phosphatidate cytidylyltransferase [Polynucleobacter rarus]|uniref:phosphatidate cytidylyltransferase n=1 Tax=Polynucleobacter rarus TaxID=556055 RepID=UPI000D3E5FD6|nr:CDP-archaeol synthase [Polynucleobacter rarus]